MEEKINLLEYPLHNCIVTVDFSVNHTKTASYSNYLFYNYLGDIILTISYRFGSSFNDSHKIKICREDSDISLFLYPYEIRPKDYISQEFIYKHYRAIRQEYLKQKGNTTET